MNSLNTKFRLGTILVMSLFLLSGCAKVSRLYSILGGGVPLYGNWCGPGHPQNTTMAPAPIDFVDTACMNHDMCYEKKGYLNCACDQAFQEELQAGFAETGKTEKDYPFMEGHSQDTANIVSLIEAFSKLPRCEDVASAPNWTHAPKVQETATGRVFFGVGRVSGLTDKKMRRYNAELAARGDLEEVLHLFTNRLRNKMQESSKNGGIDSPYINPKQLDQALTDAREKTLEEATLDKYWEDPEGKDAFARTKVDVNRLIKNIRIKNLWEN